MGILLAISILALVALLWAAISIAQHIRRVRRRNRRARAGFESEAQPAVELNFTELTRYAEAVVSRVDVPVAKPAAEPVVAERPAEVSPSVVAKSEASSDVLPMATPSDPRKLDKAHARARFDAPSVTVLDANRVPRPALQEVEQLSAIEPRPAQDVPVRTAEASADSVVSSQAEATSSSEKSQAPKRAPFPGFPEPKRSASGRQKLSRFVTKLERPDWAYFNKDMGDLTDPYEAPRKPKDRAGQ